jgi:hypothetical protein
MAKQLFTDAAVENFLVSAGQLQYDPFINGSLALVIMIDNDIVVYQNSIYGRAIVCA